MKDATLAASRDDRGPLDLRLADLLVSYRIPAALSIWLCNGERQVMEASRMDNARLLGVGALCPGRRKQS